MKVNGANRNEETVSAWILNAGAFTLASTSGVFTTSS